MSDNNYENRGTVKVVRQQLHEINDLRIKYTDIASKYRDLTEAYANLKILNTQFLGENKKYKVLLQVATKEIQGLKKEIVEDLNELRQPFSYELLNLIRKWEAK